VVGRRFGLTVPFSTAEVSVTLLAAFVVASGGAAS
jgi:hypothetical protein